ncbi:MAG: hypothetical protein EZS28_001381 [Streblomastix strix]|uniref:Uncharacterized protein n=1 Tax=Streblomastix strix TaxID=222440 RepID=A0A5J4X778_9EUKA|nr:MAG: hypothetical protein EZS28_001381 [Streblomastix strix]
MTMEQIRIEAEKDFTCPECHKHCTPCDDFTPCVRCHAKLCTKCIKICHFCHRLLCSECLSWKGGINNFHYCHGGSL